MESCLTSVQSFSPSSQSWEPPAVGNSSWFCVRTHPKHEHIAAAQLRQELELEVFLPRIRYRRSTRLGQAWVTEALFKDYLFARFELASSLRRVQHARAVRGVVRFGERWPIIPEHVISQLQAAIGSDDVRLIDETLQPGDAVLIATGAMLGLQAVVSRIMPARERVAVLLEFLGRQTEVELGRNDVTYLAEEEGQRIRAAFWQTSAVLPSR